MTPIIDYNPPERTTWRAIAINMVVFFLAVLIIAFGFAFLVESDQDIMHLDKPLVGAPSAYRPASRWYGCYQLYDVDSYGFPGYVPCFYNAGFRRDA